MTISAHNFSLAATLRYAFFALMAACLSACGGDGDEEFAVTVQALEITPSPASVDIGGTTQLVARLVFSNGQKVDVSDAVWASQDTAVVTVDSPSGLVNAAANDFASATVTASHSGFTAQVTVNVGACGEANPPINSLELTPSGSATTTSGELIDFTATATYCTGGTVSFDRTNEVTWTSSDPSVLDIGSDGRAAARSAGSVVISAAFDGATETVDVTVAPAAVEVVQVTPTSPEVIEGFTAQLKARAIRSDNTQEDVTAQAVWTSADPLVASVDATGLVTGVNGNGSSQSVVITATFDDNGNSVAGSRSIEVIFATLDSIEILSEGSDPGDPLAKGLSRQYSAFGTFTDNGTPARTFGQDISDRVTWTSNCTNSLTIGSADGLASALEASAAPVCAGGQVTISVAGNGTAVTQDQTVIVTDAVLIDGTLEVVPDTAAIAKGETQQFMARGDFSDGTMNSDLTANVQWSATGTDSGGNAVASIDAAGLATGLNQGASSIAALYTGATQSGNSEPAATAALQVGGRVLVSIAVASNDDDDSVPSGVTVSYTATGTYSDNTQENITTQVIWSSDDPSIADIDSGTGVATTDTVGTATIKAAQGSIDSTIDLDVTAAELVGVAITPASASVARGDTLQLTATASYTDGSTQDVTTDANANWSTDDNATASVGNAPSTKGKVTGKLESAAGTSVTISVSVTIGGITESGTSSITVTPPRVISLLVEFVDGDDGTLTVSETASLKVTAFYADGSDEDVTTDADTTYRSSNDGVASVDGNGVITGVSQGSARVDVEFSSGGTSKAKFVDITVTP